MKFRPWVLHALERGIERASGQERDDLSLERLGYLFRRGRWPALAREVQAGAFPPRARSRVLLWLGLSLREDGQFAAARRVFDGRWKETEGAERSPYDLVLGAWSALLRNQSGLARERAEAALAGSPGFFYGRLALAVALAQGKALERSEQIADALLPAHRDHPTLLRLRVLYPIQRGDTAEAARRAKALLRVLEPSPPPYMLSQVANAQLNAGQLDDAREKYETLLLAAPKSAEYRFQLAIIDYQQGQHERSYRSLGELWREDPQAFARHMQTVHPQALREQLTRRAKLAAGGR
jgi:tetratricopeptide (TPR) repeat protein